MKRRTYQKTPAGCPVEATLDAVGGKYKGVILYHLLTDGTLRFSQLRRLMPDVTPRMLTRQLRELEAAGVIDRQVYPVVPPKVEYRLTDLGRALGPALREMKKWGLILMARANRAERALFKATRPPGAGASPRVAKVL